MNIDLVIMQIRAYCPLLAQRVGGAADFDVLADSAIVFSDPALGKLAYPSAVVIPLEDDAEPNSLAPGPGLHQKISEKIGVVVEFDATADRRGQGGVSQVEGMKYALYAALLNWNPNPLRSAFGLMCGGGQLLKQNRARVLWQYSYTHEIEITDGDGFQLRGDPLTNITANVTLPSGDPLFSEQIFPTPATE